MGCRLILGGNSGKPFLDFVCYPNNFFYPSLDNLVPEAHLDKAVALLPESANE